MEKLSEILEVLRTPGGDLLLPAKLVDRIMNILKLHEAREAELEKFLNQELGIKDESGKRN